MIKKILSVCLILLIGGCISFTKKYQDSVPLPEGTSLKIAQEIAMTVWNNNYKQKIKNKFPNLTEKQLNGLFIKWMAFKSMTGDKKTTVSIIIGIQYRDNLSNAKAIIDYGKSIIKEAVENYFKNKT